MNALDKLKEYCEKGMEDISSDFLAFHCTEEFASGVGSAYDSVLEKIAEIQQEKSDLDLILEHIALKGEQGETNLIWRDGLIDFIATLKQKK